MERGPRPKRLISKERDGERSKAKETDFLQTGLFYKLPRSLMSNQPKREDLQRQLNSFNVIPSRASSKFSNPCDQIKVI